MLDNLCFIIYLKSALSPKKQTIKKNKVFKTNPAKAILPKALILRNLYYFILFIGKQCYKIIFNSIPFVFNIYICVIDFTNYDAIH